MNEEELITYQRDLFKRILALNEEIGVYSGLDEDDYVEEWECLLEEIQRVIEYENTSI